MSDKLDNPTGKWIDPALTRAILDQWQRDGCPAEQWEEPGYPLWRDGEQVVWIRSAAELVRLTRGAVETTIELND